MSKVTVNDLEVLIAFIRQNDQDSINISDAFSFLEKRCRVSSPDKPNDETSNDTSISSGLSFIGTPFTSSSETFRFGTPATGSGDESDHENKGNGCVDQRSDETYLSEAMDEMKMDECPAQADENSWDLDGLEDKLGRVHVKGEADAPHTSIQPDVDILSANLASINFNLGTGGVQQGSKKFGVKPKIGKTPVKSSSHSSSLHAPPVPPPAADGVESRQRNSSAARFMDTNTASPKLPDSFDVPAGVKFDFNLGLSNAQIKISPSKGKKASSKQKSRPNHSGRAVNPANFPVSESWNSTSAKGPFVATGDSVHRQSTERLPPQRSRSAHPDLSADAIVENLRRQGKELYTNEEYSRALSCFSKVLEATSEQSPLYATVLANRAATYMMLDRFIEVCADCDKVILLDPRNIKIFCRKGRALLKLGSLREAEVAFSRVLEAPILEFSSSEPDSVKADAKSGLKTVMAATSLLTKLRMLESISDFNSIAAVVEELMSICPYSYEFVVLKSKCLCSLKKFLDLKTFIEDSVCNFHSSLLAKYSHANVSPVSQKSALDWREDGQGRLVANHFMIVNFMLYMGPSLAACYATGLKNVAQNKSAPSVVISIVQTILGTLLTFVQQDSAWLWVHESSTKVRHFQEVKLLADSLFKEGQYLESIRFYSDALKIDSDASYWNAILYSNRAAAYVSLGMLREALVDCHNSLAREPDYMKAVLRRARVHKALGDLSACIRDYRKFLWGSSPGSTEFVEAQGELEEAMTAFLAGVESAKRAHAAKHEWPKDDPYTRPGAARKAHYNSPPHSTASSKPSSSQIANGTRGNFYNESKPKFRESAPGNQPQRNNPVKKTKTHYDILGVHSAATEKELKAAYRKLALKYHPDKGGDENVFKDVTGAYSVLSDKMSKREYDLTLL